MSAPGPAVTRAGGHSASVPLFCSLWILATTGAGALGWLAMVIIGYGTMGCGMVLVWVVVGGLVGLAQGTVLAWYSGASLNWKSWVRPVFDWLSGTRAGDIAGDRAATNASSASIAVGWAIVCAVAFLMCIASVFISGIGLVALLSNPWRGLLAYAVGGAVYGLMQCSFLDLGLRRTFWWVAVTTVGWALGDAIGALPAYPIAEALSPDSGYGGIIMGPRDFAFMLVHGSIGVAVYSIITALPIALLLSRRAES